MRAGLAFVAGALVGGLIAALALRSPPVHRVRAGGVWRERAEQSERDLAAARRQLETVATELRQLSERFDDLTARFEALQSTHPDAAAAAPAAPAPGELDADHVEAAPR